MVSYIVIIALNIDKEQIRKDESTALFKNDKRKGVNNKILCPTLQRKMLQHFVAKMSLKT